jgi:uncharacterized membrane protein YebE (DUF533 family)
MVETNPMKDLSSSRFNMWRAVIAVIHVDTIVRPHEINFILENLERIDMNAAQRAQLLEDLSKPFDLMTAFAAITRPRDIEDFFHFASAAAWSDGDLNPKESKVIEYLDALKKQKGAIPTPQEAGSGADSYIGRKKGYVPKIASMFPKILQSLKGCKKA